ncbi:hypothetical protein SEPCBS57363_004595 [Sporothrix epigloea]|uniref:C2H2-type domain-containing protein n=1 Tax=Sporothrix epigloea TaxID=1892477 RepID=A0ABP0DVT1_9PEZI
MSPSPTPIISVNPRRVPVTRLSVTGFDRDPSLATSMLRKGATFHSPASPGSDFDSCFCPPQLYRSQSNLDDVVDAHRRRIALTLDSISATLAATHISSPKSNSDDTVFLNSDSDSISENFADRFTNGSPAFAEERHNLQTQPVNRRLSNKHASDSGLGSSIVSSSDKKHQPQHHTVRRSAPVQGKTNVRFVAFGSAKTEKLGGLSARATNRIYEHTVKPLLANAGYKVFHPILLECTTKINKRDIVCLRDLEKAILSFAPVSDLHNDTDAWAITHWYLRTKEKTKADKLYLDFCLDSVRCLQTTVEYLSEREQTRPSDSPYTAGYFIDLVDQIHNYAKQLAEAKFNEKAGSINMNSHRYITWLKTLLGNYRGSVSPRTVNPSVLTLANTDATASTDEIKLHGGIAVNGQPAVLVKIGSDGRAVSMATGLPVELEEDIKDSIRIKRSASQEMEDEEEIRRSMARRRKNAPPEDYAPKMCSVPGCTKEFKRPCDLTKHEKTHSRPWKCPDLSCKYNDYGWPTQKECDRHVNDKHSDNPPMYECLFRPCTYKSKRDSNRKQHMEKTHGWKYVRTKTNGSIKPVRVGTASVEDNSPTAYMDTSSTSLTTPQLVNNLPTPQSGHSPAVVTPLMDEFSAPLFATNLTSYDFPTCAPSDISATEILPTDINSIEFSLFDCTETFAYNSPSTASSLDNSSAYQDVDPDTNIFGDIYSAPMQLPTPEPVFNENYATSNKDLVNQFIATGLPAACESMITPAQQEQLGRLQETYRQAQDEERQKLYAQLSPFSYIAPLSEPNTMLFTPDSILDDEIFVEFLNNKEMKCTDFILYPDLSADPAATEPNTVEATHVAGNLYEHSLPSLAAGYSQPTSQVFSTMPVGEFF